MIREKMLSYRAVFMIQAGRWTAPISAKFAATAERQLRFLKTLARTRSVSKAAAAAGMSREGAYRLRSRLSDGLFALLWDRALRPDFSAHPEGHIHAMSDGRVTRLIGTHFRRESGDFRRIGSPAQIARIVVGRGLCDLEHRVLLQRANPGAAA